MSNRPHPRSARLLAALCATVAILLGANAHAQPGSEEAAAPPTPPPALSDVRGQFSVTYFHSSVVGANVAYGGQDGALAGLTLGGSLEFDLAEFAVTLDADALSFSRQQFAVRVRGHGYDGRLTLSNVPPATASEARRIDLSFQNSLRLTGLPSANMGLTYRNTGSAEAYSFSVGLTDSYRDLSRDLTGLRWNAGYRLGVNARAGQEALTSHVANLRLDLDVTEEARPEVTFRPGLSGQFRWDDRGVDSRFRQAYSITLDARTQGNADSLNFRFDVELQEGADSRTRQSVNFSTTELAPLRLTGGVSADQRGVTRQADYRLALGFDPTEFLTLDAGYHGRAGTAGSSNGVEATLGVRYALRPWYVSATANADVQFGVTTTGATAGARSIDTSGRLNLNLRYQGEPVNATLTTSLTYRGEWRGRVELSGAYQADWGGLSLTAGTQLANDVQANLSLSGHVRLLGALSLQASTDYRVRFDADADSVFTLGLGLRYDFGGER